MGSRHAEEFHFVVTSDGSIDVYPENKSSSFKMALDKPFDFGDNAWEVALEFINYPYSWTNVGQPSGTIFKFYYNDEKGVQEIQFPNWLCDNMGKLVEFIQNQIEEKIGRGKIYVGLDSLNRFKISAVNSDFFDVGFSWPMMKLLGLDGHEKAASLTVEAFEARRKYLHFLKNVWKPEKWFDVNNVNL
jgi:hypothetical protein